HTHTHTRVGNSCIAQRCRTREEDEVRMREWEEQTQRRTQLGDHHEQLVVQHIHVVEAPGVREAETPHEAYAAIVEETVGALGCELAIEPGRSLVGNAGVLLTRVLYVKQAGSRRIVIVDAAMNDLIRPALYEAHHGIRPVQPRPGEPSPADVVGPVCETADTFAVARPLPPVEPGDLLVIDSAGAYAAAMASGYNGRLPVPEVLVRGGDYAVVKPRPGFDAVLGQDRIPDWLAAATIPERRGAA
ncbi:MAG: hypothetical protein HOH66_10960, partial [Rhodospirillaceae bacterium]|nr:hypothetical protein [Rhodospirillaceae bacterium]